MKSQGPQGRKSPELEHSQTKMERTGVREKVTGKSQSWRGAVE